MKKISAIHWFLIGIMFMFSTALRANGVLILSQTTTSGYVGTTHTVSAHLVDISGNPYPNHLINFYVTSGPNSGVNGTANTNVNGDALFTYTGIGGVGVDEIYSWTIYYNVLDGSNTLQFQWTNAPPGTTVPTLTQWGLIILGIALVGVGIVYILRRRGLFA